MKILALLVFEFLFFTRYTPAQELLHDPNAAFSTATTTGKDILLIFSGSDWCIPCIRFEKKVLADSAFRLFASANLILLEADFPQRKKIPDSLRTAYETLAATFNAEGEFPHLVLLNSNHRLLATLPSSDRSAAEFITTIQTFLPSGAK